MKDQRVLWEVEGVRDTPSEPALEYETRGKQKRGLLCVCLALASTPYLMNISITLSLESCYLEATAIDCKFQIEQSRVNTRTNVANNMLCSEWTVHVQYPKASPETSGHVREVGRRVRLTEGGRKCRQQGFRQDANPASTYRCCLDIPWKAVEYTSPGLRQQR